MHMSTANPQSAPPGLTDEQRWEAVQRRDPSADNKFFYSVQTTGVYCRPSCAARLPLRKNVCFYASCEEAERAGFRPCKRCKPNQASIREQQATLIARICRMIETEPEPPALESLAKAAGLSPYHFHRLFKSTTGLTPRGYAAAHRHKRVREELARSQSVTQAIYDSGYNSNGRFYADSPKMLGMTPTAFRDGGINTRIQFAVAECSLGSILVATTEVGVCAIALGEDPQTLVNDLQDRFPQSQLQPGDAQFEQMIAAVVGFVEAPQIGLNLQLDIRGTAFQQRVWQLLREIPPGSTASYAEIACKLGNPKAVRAVAQACAANPIALAIPCHRVVRTDGALSGYRWGIERKRQLLQRERSAPQFAAHSSTKKIRGPLKPPLD